MITYLRRGSLGMEGFILANGCANSPWDWGVVHDGSSLWFGARAWGCLLTAGQEAGKGKNWFFFLCLFPPIQAPNMKSVSVHLSAYSSMDGQELIPSPCLPHCHGSYLPKHEPNQPFLPWVTSCRIFSHNSEKVTQKPRGRSIFILGDVVAYMKTANEQGLAIDHGVYLHPSVVLGWSGMEEK